jgi:hypothetical protein
MSYMMGHSSVPVNAAGLSARERALACGARSAMWHRVLPAVSLSGSSLLLMPAATFPRTGRRRDW